MPDLDGIIAAAAEVQGFCKQRNWRFCFIGGLAVARWGKLRLTVDVDLTLLTGFGSESSFVDELLGHFKGRRKDAREFALKHRVLLVENAAGIYIDVSLAGFPFEEPCIDRSSMWQATEHHSLRTCSAEDLIVLKVFASRPKDWADVEGVIERQFGSLNLAQVLRELPPLLEMKEDSESMAQFEALIERLRKRKSNLPP